MSRTRNGWCKTVLKTSDILLIISFVFAAPFLCGASKERIDENASLEEVGMRMMRSVDTGMASDNQEASFLELRVLQAMAVCGFFS